MEWCAAEGLRTTLISVAMLWSPKEIAMLNLGKVSKETTFPKMHFTIVEAADRPFYPF